MYNSLKLTIMIKSWKTFAVIAVLILVLAFVLKNFGFILGFLVGGGLVWFYGKENIQKKFNQAVEKTKKPINSVYFISPKKSSIVIICSSILSKEIGSSFSSSASFL